MSETGSDNREQQGIQALETGLTVLEVFASTSGPLRLGDIASLAGMHPAKVHRYLVSFVRKNYVVQDVTGRYQLGPSSLRLGLSSLKQTDHLRFVPDALDRLASELGESALAAGWGTEGALILHWRAPLRPVAVNLQIGTRLPLLSSAAGRVFAAYASSLLIDPVLKKEVQDGDFSAQLIDIEAIASIAKERVRSQGVAMVEGEFVPGLNSIAAPVFNHQGEIVLALALVGLEQTFTPPLMRECAQCLRSITAEISAQLGFRNFANLPFKDTNDWA